ncbi:HAD family phosphatase [Allobranchiibius sp. CTAmp26]|uniref:HAD family hydrolase n=1 Tax=Allobranchiibius sp. CTAmp26 TaxID=2815214 RepID=UPI001AA1955A|nr:HAD family phosphatase [Allobranchiibius sp. CTAmp26]MBO1756348.1 HAD family phosphatase [Allobranchiibius sp. CTAmp26]
MDAVRIGRIETPRAVLWDLDGTLIDSEPLWHAEEQQFVQRAGGIWTATDRRALIGMTMTESSIYLLSRSPRPPTSDVDEVSHRIIDGVITRLTHRVPWCAGAPDLLDHLTAHGIPQALVTSAWPAFIEAAIGHLPRDTFTVVIDGQSVQHGKPHPEPYRTAAKRLGFRPADCLAIEDSEPGIRSATAAGVPTLAITDRDTTQTRVVTRPTLEGLTMTSLGEAFHDARLLLT